MRSYGLPSMLARHLLVFALAAGAVVAQGVWLGVAVHAQFSSWLFVAVGVGVLSALIARRVLGLLFVAAGTTFGLLAIFVIQQGATQSVSDAALRVGLLYVQVLEVALLAYLLTAIALTLVTRRR